MPTTDTKLANSYSPQMKPCVHCIDLVAEVISGCDCIINTLSGILLNLSNLFFTYKPDMNFIGTGYLNRIK